MFRRWRGREHHGRVVGWRDGAVGSGDPVSKLADVAARPIAKRPVNLRENPEFQSALVRVVIWILCILFVGAGAAAGVYTVHPSHYVVPVLVYLVSSLAIVLSLLLRAAWEARRYLSLLLDVLAATLTIYVTRDPISPFYLLYIWIFVSAGARYGRTHLMVAAVAALAAYNSVLVVLDAWHTNPLEVAFHVLVLVLLPIYQDALLRKLREARRAAEQANRAKGAFLANMTHELRTPLTGVLGMAALLQGTRLDNEQREYVDAIVSSANMLQALIGDILDLSKIDAKKLRLEHKRFDLRAPIEEVCDVLRGNASAKGVALNCEIGPGLPSQVVGDQLRLRQVLFNLVGNAVKFTATGEIRVRACISPPHARLASNHLLIEVSDTGIGIPADKLEQIFEGFQQADDSTTRRFGGTGLGTTIARDLVALMGGCIEVESQEGRGSRFSVRIPLPDQQVVPLSAVADEPAPSGRPAHPAGKTAAPVLADAADLAPVAKATADGKQVLVAEDNEIAGRVIKALLVKQGAAVTLVQDGIQALNAVRDQSQGFDLAFIDLRMPGLDGIGFTRALRANEGTSRHLNVIALTANASEDVRAQCLEAGMDAFLTKPVDPAALLEAVAKFSQ